jgi:hypothetical protein
MSPLQTRRTQRRHTPQLLLLISLALWSANDRVEARQIVDTERPRIAYAQDGSFAIAVDALVREGSRDVWHVAVQRYTPNGNPVGPTNLFEGESCQAVLDIWLSDFQHNVELAFRSDGILLVLMQHTGEFQIGGDGVRSAEVTIGAIDNTGQRIDLNQNTTACVQQKLIFPGGKRQDRPRFALTPTDVAFVTADGFFGGTSLRNVAIRVLDNQLGTVIEEVIPHEDQGSQSAFHMFPDIATNGSLVLSTWQQCPVIDNQGNADQCDIGVQFASIQGAGLTLLGQNQRVNDDPPTANVNIWPSAAMSPTGASVIVWADTRNGFAGDVYAQRYGAQGNPVGANIRVSTGQGELYSRPEVALRGDGSFMVVWDDSSAAGFTARGRQFSAAGVADGPPFVLEASASWQTGYPDITSDGADFFYTWSGATGGGLQVFSNTPAITVSERDDLPAEKLPVADVFPNPFQSTLTIQVHLTQGGPILTEVFDLLGRRMAFQEINGGAGVNHLHVDSRDWPPGAYVIRTQAGNRATAGIAIRGW